jgi:hypothetical protein
MWWAEDIRRDGGIVAGCYLMAAPLLPVGAGFFYAGQGPTPASLARVTVVAGATAVLCFIAGVGGSANRPTPRRALATARPNGAAVGLLSPVVPVSAGALLRVDPRWGNEGR